MASHQEIAGVSDDDMVQRMVNSHGDRFGDLFWAYWAEQIAPRLPEAPTIIDLGCGPGLFIRDVARRIEQANLTGYDLTPAMINYARADQTELSVEPTFEPSFEILDLVNEPIPHADHSVDLVAMTAVLHVLDDPLAMCAEIKRVLKPAGRFLLFDWIRQPLGQYMTMMMENVPPEHKARMEKAMLRLSVPHNRYTVEDWTWLLGKGGFSVVDHAKLHSEHFRIFVCEPA